MYGFLRTLLSRISCTALKSPHGTHAVRRSSTSTGRNERIRTSDPLLPKQVRYQAAPHSVTLLAYRSRADKRTVARSNALKRNPSLCSFEIRETPQIKRGPVLRLVLFNLVAGTGFEPVTFGL